MLTTVGERTKTRLFLHSCPPWYVFSRVTWIYVTHFMSFLCSVVLSLLTQDHVSLTFTGREGYLWNSSALLFATRSYPWRHRSDVLYLVFSLNLLTFSGLATTGLIHLRLLQPLHCFLSKPSRTLLSGLPVSTCHLSGTSMSSSSIIFSSSKITLVHGIACYALLTHSLFLFQNYNGKAKFMYKFLSTEQWQGFTAPGSAASRPIKVILRIPDNLPAIVNPDMSDMDPCHSLCSCCWWQVCDCHSLWFFLAQTDLCCQHSVVGKIHCQPSFLWSSSCFFHMEWCQQIHSISSSNVDISWGAYLCQHCTVYFFSLFSNNSLEQVCKAITCPILCVPFVALTVFQLVTILLARSHLLPPPLSLLHSTPR